MTHGSLFSGVGGFDLAAQWMGWENAFHCEINPFGRQVLNYYWPNATSYEDITKTDFTIHRGTIDVLTGGFPCQPFSLAGKRKGKEDDRYLWPEMLRAIDEIRPRWVCGENVAGIVSMVQPEANRATVESTADFFGEEDSQVVTEYQEYVIETVCNDLECIGYSVQPVIIPACAVGAPHKRDRIWFIAHAIDGNARGASGRHEGESGKERIQERNEVREPGQPGGLRSTSDTISCKRPKGRLHQEGNVERLITCARDTQNDSSASWQNFPTQPPVRGRNDGVSAGLAGITVSKHRNESIKAYGNAIVPQVVYQIFKAIEQWEHSSF